MASKTALRDVPKLNEVLKARGIDPKALAHAGAEYYDRQRALPAVVQYGAYLVAKGIVDSVELALALAVQSHARGDSDVAIRQLEAADEEIEIRRRQREQESRATDPPPKEK